MVRTGLFVAAGWVAAATAATAVAWSAVSVVRTAVETPDRPAVQAGGSTPQRSPASTPPASPSTSPRPPAQTGPTGGPSSGATSATERANGVGGSVVYRCAGGTLTVLSMIPKAGFTLRTDDSDRGEIRFESESHRTDIEVGCPHGSPNATVDEDDRGGGSGPG